MTVTYGTLQVEQIPTPLRAPTVMQPRDVSVIVPVRDNAKGLTRLLEALRGCVTAGHGPREVIVVDDGSQVPVTPHLADGTLSVSVFRRVGSGPAAARNAGAKQASGSWLLFTDSDCEPTPTWIHEFSRTLNGSVAYAGGVRAKGHDALSKYYDTQRILIPPPGRLSHPAYLVTANALVWKPAFDCVNGFDDRFPYAAGEDIDFGLRLWRHGDISYAPGAFVVHDFQATWTSFVQRFIRYGRGNRVLADHYRASIRPRPFVPAAWSSFNAIASIVQYASMAIGYETEYLLHPRRALSTKPVLET